MLFISGPEIFVILLIVLLLFGANKIPEIARGLGKGVSEFKKASNELKKEFEKETKDIKQEVKDVKKSVNKTINEDLKG
jgi:sec-independent protein translocase protein TatA